MKSILTSLYQREDWFDRLTMTLVILSLPKDGKEGIGEDFLINGNSMLRPLITMRQRSIFFYG